MTMEERVRDATRQHAALVEPDPDGWERVQERYGAARRRRAQRRGAAVALAASVLVFGGAMALFTGDRGGDSQGVTAGPDRTSPSSPTTALPTTTAALPPTSAPVVPPPTTAPPPAPPTAVVAISHTATKDRVVVLDAATGRTLRVLFEVGIPPELSRMISGLTLAPDGRSVWFGVEGTGCEQYRVRRVPIGGGRVEEAAEGGAPAVSPDGRYLAYAARSSARGGPPAEPWRACLDTIVVRDLSTGRERVWLPPAEPANSPYGSGGRITWAPDGRRLAFDLAYEGSFVRVLDTSRAGDQGDASFILRGSGPAEGLEDYLSPVWLPGGNRVAVAASCCYGGADSPSPSFPHGGEKAVVAIDVTTRVTNEILPSASEAIACLDVDSSGQHVVYTTWSGTVMLRSADGQPRVLARGFAEAVW